MESIITLAIFLWIVFRILKKNAKRTEKDTAYAEPKHASRPPKSKNAGVNPNMPVKASGVSRKDGKVSSTLRDDRTNDWLARQLRDERNSLIKLREMFGFKMQGRNLTDAELLKEFHAGHCDAGSVDMAKGQ